MSSFIKKFEKEYFNKLNYSINWKKRNLPENIYQRGEGYRLVFNLLINQQRSSYDIVETGVLRRVEEWVDGQSTLIFQEFLKKHSGKIDTVDIDPAACEVAKSFLDSNFVTVHCDDSVNFLKNYDCSTVALFHLDSYDVEWDNPQPSAQHHLSEFLAIENKIPAGSIVLIDDNLIINGERTGKGLEIYNYLKSKNKLPIYDSYQLIYQF
jgi:hypothetical protein